MTESQSADGRSASRTKANRKKKKPLVGEHGPALEQLAARPVQWLVEGLIPLGCVTGITGPSDAGKSTFASALAADASGGPRLVQGTPRALGPTLWYTVEEDPASMVRPRLEAAGVPPGGCLFPQHDASGLLVRRLALPGHASQLERAVKETRAALVVIDPNTDHMEDGANPNGTTEARGVMVALNRIASVGQCAVLVVMQNNKMRGGSTADRIAGNASWSQTCRVVIRLGKHPARREERLLTFGRFALGPKPATRLYVIEESDGQPRFRLLGQAEYTDDDLNGGLLDSYQWEEAIDGMDWLRGALEEGRQEAKALYRRWLENGYGRNYWWRARKELGICVIREGQGTSHTAYLSLPGSQPA